MSKDKLGTSILLFSAADLCMLHTCIFNSFPGSDLHSDLTVKITRGLLRLIVSGPDKFLERKQSLLRDASGMQASELSQLYSNLHLQDS